MSAFLAGLFRIALTASLPVLAVLLLRALFPRLPKWTRAALWSVVALRLMVPFTVECSHSPLPPVTVFSERTSGTAEAPLPSEADAALPNDAAEPTDGQAGRAEPAVVSQTDRRTQKTSRSQAEKRTICLFCVWLSGAAALQTYAAISYYALRRRTAEAVRVDGGYLLCDRIRTPFLFGLIRPRICLPADTPSADLPCILAHERAHLRRGDRFWKALAFLLLSVYWFQPLVWLSFALFCCDLELACDEKALRMLSGVSGREYAAALLRCAAPKRFLPPAPLAFGETGVRRRIGAVLKNKKPVLWTAAAASVLALLIGGIALTARPASIRSLRELEGRRLIPQELLCGDPLSSLFPEPAEMRSVYFLENGFLRTCGMDGVNVRTVGKAEPASLPEGFASDSSGALSALLKKTQKENKAVLRTDAGPTGTARDVWYLLLQKDGALILWRVTERAQGEPLLRRAGFTLQPETAREDLFREPADLDGSEFAVARKIMQTPYSSYSPQPEDLPRYRVSGGALYRTDKNKTAWEKIGALREADLTLPGRKDPETGKTGFAAFPQSEKREGTRFLLRAKSETLRPNVYDLLVRTDGTAALYLGYGAENDDAVTYEAGFELTVTGEGGDALPLQEELPDLSFLQNRYLVEEPPLYLFPGAAPDDFKFFMRDGWLFAQDANGEVPRGKPEAFSLTEETFDRILHPAGFSGGTDLTAAQIRENTRRAFRTEANRDGTFYYLLLLKDGKSQFWRGGTDQNGAPALLRGGAFTPGTRNASVKAAVTDVAAPEAGLTFSVSRIRLTRYSADVTVLWENRAETESPTFGCAFCLVRKTDGGARSCMPDDLVFRTVGYALAPGGKKEMTYDLDLCDLSEPGDYRMYLNTFDESAWYFDFTLPPE